MAAVISARTAAGRVIGVDHDEAMVAEAQRRFTGHPAIDVRLGDAHALPVPARSVDRVRLDRVIQHLADPPAALADVRRVLRPGGLAAFAEPDWDTLAIDDEDLAASRAYTRFVTSEVVRNAVVGRQLSRLADRAGLRVHSVAATSITFTDHASALSILRMPDVASRAVAAGFLDADAAASWLDRLATGSTFLASFTFYTVVAQA